MKFFRATAPARTRGNHRPRAIAALALAAALTGGSAILAAAPASAATDNDYSLRAFDSGLFLDVVGASTAAGAPIDIWAQNENSNQQFTYPNPGQIAEIINQGSNMCITTDGIAGDTLTQEPCQGSLSQYWYAQNITPWYEFGEIIMTLTNPASGLVMDVSGGTFYEGAAVDAYWPNGGHNQEWVMPGCITVSSCS